MSVDYYSCDCCGDSRYEEFVGQCTSCGHSVCTLCVVNDDIKCGYASDYGVYFDGTPEMAKEYGIDMDDYEEDDLIKDTSIAPCYCPFCQGEKVADDDLLQFVLNKFGTTKEAMEQEYLEQKREE